MAAPNILGRRRTVSATTVLNLVGKGLNDAAAANGLGNLDVGRVIGKSDDTAANYRNGTTEAGVTAFAFATQEWGAAFADPLLNELGYRLAPITAEPVNPHATAANTGQFLAELLTYLADGRLTHGEKLSLASTLRPLMPKLQALLSEAAAIVE